MAYKRYVVQYKYRNGNWTLDASAGSRSYGDTVRSVLDAIKYGWAKSTYMYRIVDTYNGYAVMLEDSAENFATDKYDNWDEDSNRRYLDSTTKQVAEIYNSTNKENTMAATTPFEYTVILHAKPSKDSAGNDTTEDSKIIIPPKVVIAKSLETVKLIASRDLTKLTDEELGRIDIRVRQL